MQFSICNIQSSLFTSSAPSEKPALESTDVDSPKTSMKKRFNVLATQRAQWDHVQEGNKDFVDLVPPGSIHVHLWETVVHCSY